MSDTADGPAPTGTPSRVALCGLGPMGAPIAERVLRAGVPLTVWNRTSERAGRFSALGAQIAESPRGCAGPVVLTVLPDLSHVQQLVDRPDGLLAGWEAHGIADPVLVIHGTTSPVATADYAERMRREHGVAVVDAPLSGGTVGAAEGTLSIMVGGDERAARALEPLFGAYGRVVKYFGASGNGELAKACNQIVVATTVAAISEALTLARRAGIDPRELVEVLEGGLAGSEVLRQKKPKWLSGDFREGGSARNQLKDLRFVAEAAEQLHQPLPVAEAVRDLFARMIERGDGSLDHTGVIRTVEAMSETGEG